MPPVITTDVYWDVDGTELNRLCWNIRTLGDGRSSVPKYRGDDTVLAYRPGARHEEKGVDVRVLSLQMWVNGWTDQGAKPSSKWDESYEKNLRDLRAVFWKDDGAEFLLTKRWRESGAVKSAQAYASLASDLAPAMHGPYAGSFGVDLLMANPWFYEAQQTAHLVKDTPLSVTNSGDARTNGYGGTLTFTGPLQNPKVTNGSVWVQAGVSLATADTIVLDLWEWTAMRTSDGANVIGAITHSGARQWMPLSKGSNSLVLTATSGTGTADLVYRVPRF